MGRITEVVLSGEDAARRFLRPLSEDTADASRALLIWLREQVSRRYSDEPNRGVNYEDLYFLASQIADDLNGNYDNPAVRPMVEMALKKFRTNGRQTVAAREAMLLSQVSEVADQIRRCVTRCLSLKLEQPDYLDFVAEAVKDSGDTGIDILTLNHDTLVEQYLRHKGISFADGFAQQANAMGLREWQPGLLDNSTHFVRLLKLHGGLNWYRIVPRKGELGSEEYLGAATEAWDSRRRDEEGRCHEAIGELPVFLIGTFNKLWKYTDTAYLQLYYRAYRILAETDVLVVVGYGFGDKGINKRILDWLLTPKVRRMIVVDLYACNLWQRARGSIAGRWHGLVEDKRLFPVQFDLRRGLPWQFVKRLVIRPEVGEG